MTESLITMGAQQTADFSGFMAMIDMRNFIKFLSTNPTTILLF